MDANLITGGTRNGYVLSGRGVRADLLSRGVLTSMVCLWSWNLNNEAA